MAKIVDPDLITPGSEVTLNSATKKITLAIAGNLSNDGINLNTLYSYLKIQWKNDADLIKFTFPMVAITVEQFELVGGWDFADSTSRNLIRDGGWSLKDLSGNTQETYMNLTTLGNFDNPSVDQAYYLQSEGGTPTNVVLTGPVNQAIKIYGDGSHGSIDYRNFFKIYLREPGKTYGFYDLISSQNLTVLENKKYALPLSNGIDLKVDATDVEIDSDSNGIADLAPYSGMSINYLVGSGFTSIATGTTYSANAVIQDSSGRWYKCISGGTVVESAVSGNTGTAVFTPYTGERLIGANYYAYNIIVNGNNAQAEKIYEYLQWSLRQTVDIDSTGTVRGDTATELSAFIGDTLRTSTGVYIDNFQATDTNRLQFVDATGTQRTFPYVAAGSLVFNDNLYNDADSIYRVFFTNDDAGTNLGRDYGTISGITINDNSGVGIFGEVSGQTSISFDFDYDFNVQRGAGSAGTDAPYTAVAIGLSGAQFVVTTGTIIRSTTNNINFVAALERNYTNP